VPLRSILPEIPEYVEEALGRAMSKQRSDRFPSTSDFFEALAGYGAGSPLSPSERGARAEGLGATPNWGRRTATPGGTAQARNLAGMTPAAAAGTSAAPPDSIDAMVTARARRRRASAFIVGLGAAVLLAVAFPALRGRPPEEPPGRSAAPGVSAVAAPPSGQVPSAAPSAAPPSAALPSPPAATTSAPTAVAAPSAAGDPPAKAPVSHADALAIRHPRSSKHQNTPRDGHVSTPPAGGQVSPPVAPVPVDKPRGAPEPATPGRLVEEL